MYTKVKTEEEIQAMREGGKMLATVLNELKSKVVPGISTKEIADLAAAILKPLGGAPAFLGQYDFPDVICISVNDEVVHGIPKPTHIIQEGDIVGLDFGVKWKGLVTDGAISVIAGQADGRRVQMVKDTERALLAGIDVLKDGVRTGDIAAAIQAVLDQGRYGIVRDMVGHGVGHELHEGPDLPNYGHEGTGDTLKAGMTIALEPMSTLGGHAVYMDRDRWTIKTRDGSASAHFEHTVLITQDGYEILTSL
jgi:methionyl aminopeptidase